MSEFVITVVMFSLAIWISNDYENRIMKEKQFRLGDRVYSCKNISEFPKLEE
jgi:hypothetical protein